ncbi:MAG: VCBS repeat-containing protein [Planctomycetota bacterium]|nr:MAG: VCBS repeat-containing protein [Planctomycetota bacterium]REK29670.1 MAG: VCBS repeat-containing protein [Planctomycetota bacterium]REK30510.1 MAG: VCBS repeat-containing protein [Planctomycetota bacterium]
MKSTLLAVLLAGSLTGVATAGFPEFEAQTIDAEAAEKAVYAVALADVDGDGLQDVVAVTENRVQWYRNPDWGKHVILEDQTELDNVCIAPHDIDGDGQVDFALGAGWTRVGTIQWITRDEDPDAKWRVHAIGVEPWTHRMRWADVLETGTPQLVVSPLNAVDAAGVRLLAFEIPEDPQSGRWPSTVLDDSMNRMHNHWHFDFGTDNETITVTASEEGLHAIWKQDDGGFGKRKIGSGMPGEDPASRGAGEVKIGRFASGRPYMATIEPMHGTSVVVYTTPGELAEGQLADRFVVDESLKAGHAVWTANLDEDGDEELVIGHREAGAGDVKGPGVYVYDPTGEDPSEWTKHVVDDGGMACEDLICADLDGDGRVDIIAGGRATRNVKIYWNRAEGDR